MDTQTTQPTLGERALAAHRAEVARRESERLEWINRHRLSIEAHVATRFLDGFGVTVAPADLTLVDDGSSRIRVELTVDDIPFTMTGEASLPWGGNYSECHPEIWANLTCARCGTVRAHRVGDLEELGAILAAGAPCNYYADACERDLRAHMVDPDAFPVPEDASKAVTA